MMRKPLIQGENKGEECMAEYGLTKEERADRKRPRGKFG